MVTRWSPQLLLLLVAASGVCSARAGSAVPELRGVNIHFTEPQQGEVELLAQAFAVARMDFTWSTIEAVKGVYDFAQWDTLLASLQASDVTPYWILDYSNALYEPRYTDEWYQGFTAFTLAAMKHYQGVGVVWELWNEVRGRCVAIGNTGV